MNTNIFREIDNIIEIINENKIGPIFQLKLNQEPTGRFLRYKQKTKLLNFPHLRKKQWIKL